MFFVVKLFLKLVSLFVILYADVFEIVTCIDSVLIKKLDCNTHKLCEVLKLSCTHYCMLWSICVFGSTTCVSVVAVYGCVSTNNIPNIVTTLEYVCFQIYDIFIFGPNYCLCWNWHKNFVNAGPYVQVIQIHIYGTSLYYNVTCIFYLDSFGHLQYL